MGPGILLGSPGCSWVPGDAPGLLPACPGKPGEAQTDPDSTTQLFHVKLARVSLAWVLASLGLFWLPWREAWGPPGLSWLLLGARGCSWTAPGLSWQARGGSDRPRLDHATFSCETRAGQSCMGPGVPGAVPAAPGEPGCSWSAPGLPEAFQTGSSDDPGRGTQMTHSWPAKSLNFKGLVSRRETASAPSDSSGQALQLRGSSFPRSATGGPPCSVKVRKMIHFWLVRKVGAMSQIFQFPRFRITL